MAKLNKNGIRVLGAGFLKEVRNVKREAEELKTSVENSEVLFDFLFGERDFIISEPKIEIVKATGEARYTSVVAYEDKDGFIFKKKPKLTLKDKVIVFLKFLNYSDDILDYLRRSHLTIGFNNCYEYNMNSKLSLIEVLFTESKWEGCSKSTIKDMDTYIFNEFSKNTVSLAVRYYRDNYIKGGMTIDDVIDDFEYFYKSHARFEGRRVLAKSMGLSRPDLFKHYNIDPKVFAYIDQVIADNGLDPKLAYDSYGNKGLNPSLITKAWFNCGTRFNDKFKYFVKYYVSTFKRFKSLNGSYILVPGKNDAFDTYRNRVLTAKLISDAGLDFKDISMSDVKRLGHLSFATKWYAINECLYDRNIIWSKVNEFTKLSKREKAKHLSFGRAWTLLFNRKAPVGLTAEEPNPTLLLDKVSRKSWMNIMTIIKDDSQDNSSLAANTRAAYHLVAIFRDTQSINRWVKKVAGDIDALAIHDSFVNANHFNGLVYKAGWLKMLNQFPELRWDTGAFKAFEANFNRLPESKKEFEAFAKSLVYEEVSDVEVARIAGSFHLDQDEFEDYEKFFEKNGPKMATMIPAITISEGDYTFRKLEDHDKFGPFLGLATDCCQHLHNAGSSCAKSGWIDSESGFYVVEKAGKVIAQSWAWRGKDDALCFDSIEGLSNINAKTVASLYKQAAELLLGRLNISRVTVGDTSYGITGDIKYHLNGESCKPSKMIKKVSYTDANNQWLLAE